MAQAARECLSDLPHSCKLKCKALKVLYFVNGVGLRGCRNSPLISSSKLADIKGDRVSHK